MTEEQFGPVIPVIPFETEEEAIAMANDTWAGLGGSVWTADRKAANRVGGQLVCGYVWVNDHGATRLDLRAPHQTNFGPDVDEDHQWAAYRSGLPVVRRVTGRVESAGG